MNKIVQLPPVSCVLNDGSATHECNQMCASLLRGGNLAVSWYGRSPNSVMKILLLVLLYYCAHIYHHLSQGFINVV